VSLVLTFSHCGWQYFSEMVYTPRVISLWDYRLHTKKFFSRGKYWFGNRNYHLVQRPNWGFISGWVALLQKHGILRISFGISIIIRKQRFKERVCTPCITPVTFQLVIKGYINNVSMIIGRLREKTGLLGL